MALLTAGTQATTTCKALVWQPSGMNTTDLAALMALIKNPADSATAVILKKSHIQNGRLFMPGDRTDTGMRINPGDYILVDAGGWPFIVPSQTFAGSWSHS